jgi:IS5 family transposase
VPIAAVPAPANVPDHRLLGVTLDALKDVAPLPPGVTVHLDAGYDYAPCRAELDHRGLHARIARRGIPAPIQNTARWPVERTNSWLNDFGKLRRCTERREINVQAFLDLAIAVVTLRALLRESWYRYRWQGRPHSPRIR